MNCPICESSSKNFLKKYDYWILSCPNCRHQYVNINPSVVHAEMIYSDNYFEGGGDGYLNYLNESQIIRGHGQQYGRILKRYMIPGTVLDIGAAAGFILQGLVDEGWSGQGIEPNDKMANYARTELGLFVQTGTLEQLATDEKSFDLVTMIQVIPHFYNLRLALQIATDVTKPQGFWLIETWNRESLTAKIFGKNWHEYSPPSVLHWFSPDDLSNLAAQYGFTKVAIGKPEKWINGSHVKSLLRYKLQDVWFGKFFLAILNLIPDSLAIPYPAEDLFWILFQKS